MKILLQKISIVLLLSIGYSNIAIGQVIDFEDLTVTEGSKIFDQYSEGPCGVKFYLGDPKNNNYPVLAKVGGNFSCAFKGPLRSDSLCNITTPVQNDMPAPGQNVGCNFLTDDCLVSGIPDALNVVYNTSTDKASGYLLDIDGSEEWTVTAFNANDVQIGTSLVLCSSGGCSGTTSGDGIATYWEFNITTSIIKRIQFEFTGTGSNIGLAFDNFSACSIQSEGAYCCEGENLAVNGNFENGDMSFFSAYSSSVTVLPGEYNITTSASAFGTNVTDHSFCVDPVIYANSNNYMVANGKTQQTVNEAVWVQAISGLEEGANYKFCANFKNLPQCAFDVLPKVELQVGTVSSGFQTINVSPNNPCEWESVEVNFTATVPNLFFRIMLDQTGNGDGNDVAIDDIAIVKLSDADLDISVQHQGNPQIITASLNTIDPNDDVLHGEECEYFWFAAEVVSYPPIVVNGATLGLGNQTGNSGTLPITGGAPWLLTTDFPQYQFAQNTLYIIGMYVPECGCYDAAFTYQLTYNNRAVDDQITEEQKQQIIDWILYGYDGSLDVVSNSRSDSENFTLYPNPTKERINMKLLDETIKGIEILTISGRLVMMREFVNGKNEESIDVSILSSGMYIVKVVGKDGKRYTAKLVVE